MGLSDAAEPPVTGSQNRNVVWKKDLLGPAGSSPLVSGDRVF